MGASRELSMGRYSRTHGKSGNTEQRENSELSCKCLSAKKQYGGGGGGQRFSSVFIQLLVPRCFWEKGGGGHGSFTPF